MPIYEYECDKCKKVFEYTQGIKEPKKEVCEACGGKLERLISPSGFVLKGGGWYKDLYSSSKKPDSGSKTETKSEPKSESKSTTSSSSSTTPSSSGGGKKD